MAPAAARAVGPSSVRTLLAGAIDYAGLFPPATLKMDEAVRNYGAYLAGTDAWALGRFVVPIGRLTELRESLAAVDRQPSQPWRLSVLAGAGGSAEWSNAEWPPPAVAVADAVELRARTPEQIAGEASRAPRGVDVVYEIPIESDPLPLLAAIARVRGVAKVRTGGVTADAFPTARDLARLIVACVRTNVPFKATAGLHHPLRAVQALTYAPDSAHAEMFGFLNVLLAAAFAREGLDEAVAAALLIEPEIAAFSFTGHGVAWRDRSVDAASLARTRATLALSIGSCSFREPLEALGALGLL